MDAERDHLGSCLVQINRHGLGELVQSRLGHTVRRVATVVPGDTGHVAGHVDDLAQRRERQCREERFRGQKRTLGVNSSANPKQSAGRVLTYHCVDVEVAHKVFSRHLVKALVVPVKVDSYQNPNQVSD